MCSYSDCVAFTKVSIAYFQRIEYAKCRQWCIENVILAAINANCYRCLFKLIGTKTQILPDGPPMLCVLFFTGHYFPLMPNPKTEKNKRKLSAYSRSNYTLCFISVRRSNRSVTIFIEILCRVLDP